MNQAVSAVELSSFVFASNDDIKTTSLLVAEKFGKRHGDILRTIDNIQTQVSDFFYKRNFALIENETVLAASGGVRKDRAFEMTKNGFMFLVMGFTGKQAAQIKEAYINAFDTMHAKLFPKTPYGLKIGVDKISPSQCQDIRHAVAKIAGKDKVVYQTTYWKLHEHFNVNSYKELNASDFDEAMMILGQPEQQKMVLISESELEALRNKPAELTYEKFIEVLDKSESSGYKLVKKSELQAAAWMFTQGLKNLGVLD
jgi:Rha family phage regulatory protein